MNPKVRAIILETLRKELYITENEYKGDKSEVAVWWNKADPTTAAGEYFFTVLNAHKNIAKASKRKLLNIRNALREIKRLK
jgi:hypothetical protein